jgi:hypothetical protein
MFTVLFALFCMTANVEAADPNSPHPHTGVSTKFSNPTPTALTGEQTQLLMSGKAVRRQVQGDSGGRGIAIMDVKASPDKIWTVISDFSSYPNWIDDLEKTSVYGGSASTGHKVEFNLSVFGLDITYYINHTLHAEKGYMSWELDYKRESDIDDSTGYWLVYPAPDRPGYTRVEYTVDLRLKGWVPGVVENMLAKKGLVLATSWVKKQAE